ncbi:terminase TerL endonuclease subunit [Carboxylicivirga sp. RSCT41]|uniref:terminase TerL endonuclease subunit n=1 Tax=Carboxylicivirga agarovorans TaxID=3417570 RepID=UPI003D357DE9
MMDSKTKLKNEYIEACIKKGEKYEDDAISGDIIVPDTIRLAALRNKELRKKYIYKREELEDVYKFLFYINIPRQKAGVMRFVPAAWQCFIINAIYGIYIEINKKSEDLPDPDVEYFQDENNKLKVSDEIVIERLFIDVLIFVSRKSGKSVLGGLLSLYGLMKGNRSCEVYFFGREKAQALHLLDYLKDIISISPSLNRRVKQLQYKLRYESKEQGKCKAEPLGYDSSTKDGYKPDVCVYDEFAAYPNRSIVEVMESGQGATFSPLNVFITSANFFTDYPIVEDIETGKKILSPDEELTNDRKAYFIYQLDDKHEVSNEKSWIKANPGIGSSTSLYKLKQLYDSAQLTHSGKRNFLVKNLNFFINENEGWLEKEYIERCSKKFDIEELYGGRAWVGIDMSESTDLSSITVTIEHPKTKKLHQVFKTFFPHKQENKKLRKTKLDLTEWIKKGYIIPHPYEYIDEALVLLEIEQIIKLFDVKSIVYDPWGVKKIIKQLKAKYIGEFKIESFPQEPKYFNAPIRELEKLIYSKQIVFEDNPMFRYNIDNIVLFRNYNGYVRFDKKVSKDSIDMAISSAMSIGAYLDTEYDVISLITEDEYYDEDEYSDS